MLGVSLVGAQAPLFLAAATETLNTAALLLEISDRAERNDLVALHASLQADPNLAAHREIIEDTGPQSEAQRLLDFIGANVDQLGSFDAQEIFRAARLVLVELLSDEEHDIAAFQALAPGVQFEPAAFARRFGLEAPNLTLPAVFRMAMAAQANRGVPEEPTRLSADTIDRVKAELARLGFPGINIERFIHWRADPRMPGVAHAKPFRIDEKHVARGTIVIPIFMAPGTVYGEHLHLGKEDVVFVTVGGALEDAQGSYASAAVYLQGAGSIHTPRNLGKDPVIFIGVARNGVVLTGLPGTRGAELLNYFGIDVRARLALFRDVPADDLRKGQTPRQDILRHVLRYLEYRSFMVRPERNRVQEQVRRFVALPWQDRAARAKTARARALV